MRYFRGGAQRVGGRDDHAEGEEGEVEDGDFERGRGEDEGDVVFGERVVFLEGEREGVGLAEEVRISEASTGGGVD